VPGQGEVLHGRLARPGQASRGSLLTRRWVTLVAAVVLVAGACTPAATPSASPSASTSASASASPAATSSSASSGQTTARFENADCLFTKPREVEVECGYLVVPEDRTRPSGRQIRLHVGIFNSKAVDPKPDPVVFLQGGPGGSTLNLASQILDRTPFLADRDVILFDQRGTGYSKPSLDCSEAEDFFFGTLNESRTRTQLNALDDRATAACRQRVAADADLSAYDSAENAADLADLQSVFHYPSWNLYGVSYGTRLALETMRVHPAGIRSVILDSVYPPQIDSQAGLARNADRALSLIFQQCAADQACATAYPRLDQVFSETVARLNSRPGRLAMSDWTKKRNHPAVVNGDGFVSALFDMLYDTDSLPSIPRVIYEVHDGDYDAVSQDLSYSLETLRHIAEGMYESVECGEEAAFTTPEAIRQAAVGVRPEIAGYFVDQAASFVDQCSKIWKVQSQPAVENEPVQSDIPTLLLEGEFDPITPPAMADAAAQSLSVSSVHVFPAVGHGVVGSRYCADTLMLDFLDHPGPTPKSDCVSRLSKIRFLQPGRERPAEPAATYTDSRSGVSIKLPRDWLVLSQQEASDRARLDQILADNPEYGQFIRDSSRQLDQGMVLAGHDRRAGSDIVATATPTLLVYRAPGAMLGRTLAQIAGDQAAFLRQQEDLSGPPTVRAVKLAGIDMQEIQAKYRSWHLGREISVSLVNYLAARGNDLYFLQFARPSDASSTGVAQFRDLAATLKLGG
jgi:pimeloyl-ACP methyl ester carboxylesterase